ncbi:unnamed protein product [Caenorhabditis bovis]|uniref:Uncharacterized protein n=1 Tax=Caenorhabditis bovis TaxID=2654633 RepID=A0A8S1EP13_9PELO|nr:unnamed protein product [Caenorhabditis bovis]
MHLFVYYNSTHSKEDGTWFYYTLITYFEFVCICISYPLVFYLGVLLFKYRLFHKNLQNCVKLCVIEYLVQLTTRTMQIFLIFHGKENGNAFFWASYARCTCYFFVSFSLFIIAFERCCASYFLSDYEKKNRHFIFVFILIVFPPSSAYLAWLYHIVESTIILHVAMLAVNIFCSFTILQIEKYNYVRLEASAKLRKSKKEYSLAERFQISENIRVCEFMKTIINVVSAFNLMSTISAALDNFDFSITFLNIATTFFNICVLTYGSLVFFLFYYLSPPFRMEIKRMLTWMRVTHPVNPIVDKEKPMQMAAQETDAYFDQLNKQWL